MNDVAIDPSWYDLLTLQSPATDDSFDTSPTRFASAGRDRRVLVWEYDPLEEDEPPTLSEDSEYICTGDFITHV